tara:strand:+ start:817 stop:2388 length:1572 start_codon:yes stop_codon:yes gene_type:complete
LPADSIGHANILLELPAPPAHEGVESEGAEVIASQPVLVTEQLSPVFDSESGDTIPVDTHAKAADPKTHDSSNSAKASAASNYDPLINTSYSQSPVSPPSSSCIQPETIETIPSKKNKTSFKRRAADYESRGHSDVLDSFSTAPASKSISDSVSSVISSAEPTPSENAILDSWEDVGAITPTPTPAPAAVSIIADKQAPVPTERFTYTKARLLELRVGLNTSPPAHLPSFVVERSSTGDSRAGRRLGPGGTTRGGGAGAGGGGSGGAGRYSGSMEDPRRDQGLRHNSDGSRGRHRKTDHTAASDKWDRGQRVKQRDGPHDQWGPEPFEPLKTTAHRWDRKHKSSDALDGSINKVTSILNKMTPENFEKLSAQLCDLEMTSSEMLRRVIGVLFDKAVDEPHFAVVYAALCARLAEATRVWPFIRPVKDETAGTWSWVADLDVDTSRLLPLPDFSAVAQLLEGADAGVEAIGVGQLQLQSSDCFLKENSLVCCYFAEQRPGVVRDQCQLLRTADLFVLVGICCDS